MNIKTIMSYFCSKKWSILKNHIRRVREVLKYRYIFNPVNIDLGEGAHINPPALIFGRENIHLGKQCNIDWESKLYCTVGEFIMKDFSGAAAGLTVITNNHRAKPGVHPRDPQKNGNNNLQANKVIVEENVWIAANVTLLAGVHIGRGAIIGAGTVLRQCKVPPYAIVVGNPGKVVGFRFTPEEIIIHEKSLYPEDARLPIELFKKNEEKYIQKRAKELLDFVKL